MFELPGLPLVKNNNKPTNYNAPYAATVTTMAPNNVQTCFSRRCRSSVTVGNRKQVALEAALECEDFL